MFRESAAEAATKFILCHDAININIATVLSELNEFSKAAEVLESSIGLLVADLKAQEKAAAAVISNMGGGEAKNSVDGHKGRETSIGRGSERAFTLTTLAVCYHNLAVQKLFLDSAAAAVACATAAVRLATDTKCIPTRHAWLQRMERTVDAAKRYEVQGGSAASSSHNVGQEAWWEGHERLNSKVLLDKIVP